MSPEQIRGGAKLDGRSDIYALGIVLFEMLTGTLPYKADTPAQVMMMQLANPTPHPTDLRGDLPEPINGVIVRAMAKDVELRFLKAADMDAALQSATSGKSIPTDLQAAPAGSGGGISGTYDALDTGGLSSESTKGSADQKRRQRTILFSSIGGVAVCLCVLVVGIGGYALWSNSSKRTPTEAALVPTKTIGALPEIATAVSGYKPTLASPIFLPTDTEALQAAGSTPTALSGDTFNIKIGDEISNGVPGPGAGNIETPGVKDIYIFDATAGQKVFFQLKDSTLTGYVGFTLLDDLDNKIVDTEFKIVGQSIGTVELARGGTYRLIIGSDTDASVGTYTLKLWNVPSPDTFTININPYFEISNGIPGPGAGNIETPGAKDIYSFDATAGQKVFIQVEASTMTGYVNFFILDDMDNKIVDTAFKIVGQNIGTVELARGGTYRVVIGSDNDPTVGTYTIKIWGVGSPQN